MIKIIRHTLSIFLIVNLLGCISDNAPETAVPDDTPKPQEVPDTRPIVPDTPVFAEREPEVPIDGPALSEKDIPHQFMAMRRLNQLEIINSVNDQLGNDAGLEFAPKNLTILPSYLIENSRNADELDTDKQWTESYLQAASKAAQKIVDSETYNDLCEVSDVECYVGILANFGERLQGRKFSKNDLERLSRIYISALQHTAKESYAFRSGIVALLISPHFLFTHEDVKTEARHLNNFELSERLSLALKQAIPDKKLLEARKAKYLEGEYLQSQISRLLAQDSVERFIADFLEFWLGANYASRYPIDQINFSSTTTVHYRAQSSYKEAVLFVKDNLNNDLKVQGLINARYTYLNQYNGEIYDQPIRGDQFVKSNFSEESQRAGIFTQPAFLSRHISSPSSTQFIHRGADILRALSCQKLQKSESTKALISEVNPRLYDRLESMKQREEDERCSNCHKQIDPIGIALNKWSSDGREVITNPASQIEIVTSGRWKNKNFKHMQELADILANEQQFEPCLTQQLINYFTGFDLDFHNNQKDKQLINEIIKSSKINSNHLSLRNLISNILSHPIFTTTGPEQARGDQ